ncbi:MAG TPA: bifunctional (p)ppGpp synthetase/guanosine-3',5'-bis(diphosphate) 3'-pyrophosphohydrolase [Clostridiales bacterium]|nr:bifunctional (p)ppGpp synthetase/guanosine-3',5'-bis(diphosphate) 3'-pyrophosphohydrolase [Clostridiales bacterium]
MTTPPELNSLKDKIAQYNPDCAWDQIVAAYLFAKEAHVGQVRHSGEAYISHPLAVAEILTNVEADDKTIIAGILHDVAEDTEHTIEEIETLFGKDVAVLTEGVTKLGKVKGRTKSEQKMENIRKMIFAMATDIRVIIVKLADRLHNMRTLDYHTSEVKKRQIAQETLDIYSPLANRLGVFQFKWELEDLSLKALEPEKYAALAKELASTRASRQTYIESVIKILGDKLQEAHIHYVDIYGRPKNIYSIYKKMLTQNKDLSQIYDVLAVRVIVKTVTECYGVLGTVHSLWVPVPGRFKDYVAMPKQNMYQSIHTTVISPNGKPLEVQIRTEEMHQVAEYGIAAHWQYKEGVSKGRQDQKLSWLRQMLDWQKEVKDADEFMASMKYDLEYELVYVFTPKGDVYELPRGSVPLDFAYRVHTEVGHKAIGARCNGKMVTFDYVLRNGDIMEIITSKSGKPSRDWLKIVKTPQARNKIRSWFRKEQRDTSIAKGKDIYEREVKAYGELMAEYLRGEPLADLVKRYNFASLENFYLAIGENHLTVNAVLNGIKEEIKYEDPKKTAPEVKPFVEKRGHHGIVVKGADNVMIKFAHCCNPLPGDPIIGYITRGAGITVHRRDCGNVKGFDKNRLIAVEWEDVYSTNFQAEIEVLAYDRDHLTMDIMSAISDTKTTINAVYGRSAKDGMAVVSIKMEVKSNSHFDFICNKIRRIKDVVEVRRVIHGKHREAAK